MMDYSALKQRVEKLRFASPEIIVRYFTAAMNDRIAFLSAAPFLEEETRRFFTAEAAKLRKSLTPGTFLAHGGDLSGYSGNRFYGDQGSCWALIRLLTGNAGIPYERRLQDLTVSADHDNTFDLDWYYKQMRSEGPDQAKHLIPADMGRKIGYGSGYPLIFFRRWHGQMLEWMFRMLNVWECLRVWMDSFTLWCGLDSRWAEGVLSYYPQAKAIISPFANSVPFEVQACFSGLGKIWSATVTDCRNGFSERWERSTPLTDAEYALANQRDIFVIPQYPDRFDDFFPE